MNAIFIDSKNQKVTSVNITGLKDMQALVGGNIETAAVTPCGDTVFVNDEGMFLSSAFFEFLDDTSMHPFAGNGVIVGPEDENGALMDCKSTVADIEKKLRFMNRAELLLELAEIRNEYDTNTNGLGVFH